MHTVRLFVAGLFAMLVGPTAWAAACAGFTDVDSANTTYCSAVAYIKAKGITLGCTGTTYCPNDYVTRLQMALFLQRYGQGHSSNQLYDYTATVAGVGNAATGAYSTVSGGSQNTATDDSVVSGGYFNTASGITSTVVGGAYNEASGYGSVAVGHRAQADQLFCMVISFWDTATPMSCLGSENIVRIGDLHGLTVDYYSQRPDGGGTRWVAFGDQISGQTMSSWTGGYLSDGGTWTNSSDRNAKTDVARIDPQVVLAKVAALPIATWRYRPCSSRSSRPTSRPRRRSRAPSRCRS